MIGCKFVPKKQDWRRWKQPSNNSVLKLASMAGSMFQVWFSLFIVFSCLILNFDILGNEPVKRMIFSLTVLISISTGLLGFFFSYIEFKHSGTTTSINSTTASLTTLHFPSLTVCNVNQVYSNIINKIWHPLHVSTLISADKQQF